MTRNFCWHVLSAFVIAHSVPYCTVVRTAGLGFIHRSCLLALRRPGMRYSRPFFIRRYGNVVVSGGCGIQNFTDSFACQVKALTIALMPTRPSTASDLGAARLSQRRLGVRCCTCGCRRPDRSRPPPWAAPAVHATASGGATTPFASQPCPVS